MVSQWRTRAGAPAVDESAGDAPSTPMTGAATGAAALVAGAAAYAINTAPASSQPTITSLSQCSPSTIRVSPTSPAMVNATAIAAGTSRDRLALLPGLRSTRRTNSRATIPQPRTAVSACPEENETSGPPTGEGRATVTNSTASSVWAAARTRMGSTARRQEAPPRRTTSATTASTG